MSDDSNQCGLCMVAFFSEILVNELLRLHKYNTLEIMSNFSEILVH